MASQLDIELARRKITVYLRDHGPCTIDKIAEVFEWRKERARLELYYLYHHRYVSRYKAEGDKLKRWVYEYQRLYADEGKSAKWDLHYQAFRKLVLEGIKERETDDYKV